MRDKMIHEYFGVDLRLVYEVVRLELRDLIRRIESILSSND